MGLVLYDCGFTFYFIFILFFELEGQTDRICLQRYGSGEMDRGIKADHRHERTYLRIFLLGHLRQLGPREDAHRFRCCAVKYPRRWGEISKWTDSVRAAAGSGTTPCLCVNWKVEEWRGGEGRLSHGGAERKCVISNGPRHFVVHLRLLDFNSVKAVFYINKTEIK